MIGFWIVFSYFLSIGYNTIMLDRIRKNTIKKCREKLEEAGYEVNSKKIKSILECTSTETVDDIGYNTLAYMPFCSYWISYKLIKSQIKKEYDAVSESILTPKILLKLEGEGIIFDSKLIKRLTEEERKALEKTHQIYKPGYPILVSGMERLIDGLPISEQLSMEEVNKELDEKTEKKSFEKILKK